MEDAKPIGVIAAFEAEKLNRRQCSAEPAAEMKAICL
jgi:hypothetical protein